MIKNESLKQWRDSLNLIKHIVNNVLPFHISKIEQSVVNFDMNKETYMIMLYAINQMHDALAEMLTINYEQKIKN